MCEGAGIEESKDCPVDGRALHTGVRSSTGCYSKEGLSARMNCDSSLGGAAWVGVVLGSSWEGNSSCPLNADRDRRFLPDCPWLLQCLRHVCGHAVPLLL